MLSPTICGVFQGAATRKLFVVTCKRCRRDVPAGVSEFPFQSITVECCLCGDRRKFRPSEVFLSRPDHLVGPAADQVSVAEAHLSSSGTAGKSRRELRVLSFHEQSPRQFQLLAAYTAFIVALLLLTLSMNWQKAWVAVTLFAISLPALVALLFLDQVVRFERQRKRGTLRAAALLLGTVPSVIGTAILIGRVSWVAAALFMVSVLSWVLVVCLAIRMENGENRDAPR